MHQVEQSIMQVYAKNPGRDFSTTELVREVFREESDEIQNYIYNEVQDSEVAKLGRRKKARLHRKLLYHLNKLESENVLKITRVVGKGEKFFALNADKKVDGKRDKEFKSLIDRVSNLQDSVFHLTGLENYEDEKLIKKFDTNNWINKINSMVLESSGIEETKTLYSRIIDLYPNFNDVLAIIDFEKVIDRNDLQELSNFIKKADLDTKDYNKYLNLLIDLSKVEDAVKLTDFITAFSKIAPEKIYIVFSANTKSISNHTRFLKQLIKDFSENKIRINIKNTDISSAPYLIGRAGAYTIGGGDWDEYQREIKGKTIGVCLSETSVYVDVHRFFKLGKNYSEFRELMNKASRALLLATTTQRKKSDILFKTINVLNSEYQPKFFALSQNYIRLWNYDVSKMVGDDKENFIAFLETVNAEIDEFCKSEETIFKSCGIPIRFRIKLSSAFKRFDSDFLSERKYNKITVHKISDFDDEELKHYIEYREKLGNIFQGDRVRFFRGNNYESDDIIREFLYIMNHHSITLFAYDFKSRKGEVTLDNFFGE